MRIVIHCGSGGPSEWGPESLADGIGGSEECVIYLARELALLKHEVVVFNNINPARMGIYDDGATWVNFKAEPQSNYHEHDIFIAWRDSQLFSLAHPSAKRYLWCHDIPVFPHWSPELSQNFDRVILLNEHHAKLYEAAGCPREKMFVCSNGVDLKQFDQIVGRRLGKCIYFSHPHRGLHRLREYWPRIREAIPYATLHAFWWQSECFLPPDESLGIMPMRNLGHEELAREILSADLLTYPSVFGAEINPITCIKAQVGGAWPVVVMAGGMRDTLQFGYECTYENYAEKVIEALKQPVFYEKNRSRMMHESRKRYAWSAIASLWQDEFLTELLK